MAAGPGSEVFPVWLVIVRVPKTFDACVEFGIKILTIYAFSTENWKRPQEEVKGLMSIFARVIDRELNELHRQGVQLRHMGRLEGISHELRSKVLHAIDLTRDNDRIILNVAFNYGGRAEIVDAVRHIIHDAIPAERVNEDLIGRYMYTNQ
jgi:undecaprenyl diphosphate synthase